MGCGPSVYSGPPKKVIIIGSGFMGALAAKTLEKSPGVEVTILTPDEFCSIAWAGCRALVDPDMCKAMTVPLSKCFKRAKIHKGWAKSVSASAVVTDAGVELPYDVLLIASGGGYTDGDAAILKSADAYKHTVEGRVQQMLAEYNAVKAAKKVGVVGGGFTGIEMASEIATKYPDKQVVFCVSESEFCGNMASWTKGGAKMATKLRAHYAALPNVTIMTGKKVPFGGDVHGCDKVYFCTGIKPNAGFLAGGPLASALAPNGGIKTTPTLQVEGFPNVFASGDCATPGALTSADRGAGAVGYHNIMATDSTLLPNILKVLNGESTGLKAIPKTPVGGMLALGPKAGMGFFDDMVLPDFAVKMMKSGDIFSKQYITKLTK